MRLFILTCVLVYSVSRYHDLSFLYLREGCGWAGYVAYPLVHASLAHLFVNTLTILSFWERMTKEERSALLCSFVPLFPVATYLSLSAKPTIGASGVAFSIIGVYLSSLLIHHGYKPFLKSLSLVGVIMIAQYIMAEESTNCVMHVSSLLLSMPLSYLFMRWRKRRS